MTSNHLNPEEHKITGKSRSVNIWHPKDITGKKSPALIPVAVLSNIFLGHHNRVPISKSALEFSQNYK